ncbi:MAG: topoisomerase C-terminal repeat-containing protein [Roseburia sp.]
MAKSLIITEKPSVAQEFARILKVSGRRDGYIENETYVITWCVGHLVEMVYPEEYDERYKKWRLEDLPFLPKDYKYNVIPNVSRQYDVVHRMLHREDITTVYWAGDAGKEGQTIEENIRRFGGVRKGMRELRVWIDSQTEEEILRGIREAKDMSEYDNLAKSGVMRTIEDYAMGINFSRAMSVKYGKLLNDAAGTKSYTAIAVGRVMTCVLGMVVIREREIRNFVETPFYRVMGSFLPASEGAGNDLRAEGGGEEHDGILERGIEAEWKAVDGSRYFESPLLYKENGFKERESAEALIGALAGKTAVVESIEQSIQKKRAPLLFNLAELQAECSKRFKISPDETLQAAQDLYEKKLTTYPRTDARVLSTAVAKEIVKNIGGLRDYEPVRGFVERIQKEGRHRNIVKTQYTDDTKITDHYAIIPTGQLSELVSLSDLQRRVYDLIVRRFLSIFFPPAEYQTAKLMVNVDGEKLFTSAKALKSPGYLEIAGIPKKTQKQGNEPLGKEADNSGQDVEENALLLSLAGDLRTGEALLVHGYAIREGKTSPPKRYTSGSMVLAMENAGQLIEEEELREQIKGSGIGTSATRAEIIKKLVRVGYLNLNKKTQVLTPERLGEMIFEVVSMTVPALLNPKMTASWEKGLDGITSGTVIMEDYREKLEDFIRRETVAMIERDLTGSVAARIQPLVGKGGRGIAAKRSLGISCPVCDGMIETTPFGYGCSNYNKDGTGCRFSIGAIAGRDLNDEEVKVLLTEGHTAVLNGFVSKSKKKFSASLFLEKDEGGKASIHFDFSQNQPEILEGVKCPVCGSDMEITPFGYSCVKHRENPDACYFSVGKIAGKAISVDDLTELLTNGHTGLVRGFTAKNKKKFNACLVLETAEDGKKQIAFDFSQNESEVVPGVACPVCGGQIQVKSFGFGCANYNPSEPESCKFAIGTLAGKDLNAAQVKELLTGGRTGTIRGFKSKTGKKFDACVALAKDEQGGVSLKFDFDHVEAKKVKDVACPICGGDIVVTPFGFGCANYSKDDPNSCRFSVGKMAEKSLTEANVKELLTSGRTGTIRGFKSKTGKKFDARVALSRDESGKVAGLKFDFDDLEAPKVKDVKCPLCGGDIAKTAFGFGCANYSKDNPDSCRFSIGQIAGVKLKEGQVKELLIRGKTEVIKGFVAKTGMKFDAPLKLTAEGQITFDFPEKPKPVETKVRCPKCGKLLMRSQWYYECACGFKVHHTVAQVQLPEEIVGELLETGGTKEKVTGFVSRAGNNFDACLKFENDHISFDFANPGNGSLSGKGGQNSNAAGGDGVERPFYEEIEEGAAVFVPDGARLQEDAPIFREKPQYVDENVPPFYDAMAEEFAARQAEEESEQSAGMNFLDEFVK